MHVAAPPPPPHACTAGGNIQKVVIKMLATLSEVAPAIAEGSVDMVYGLDTIGPQQFKDLHLQDEDNLKTYISQPLSTRAVIVNSNKPPLDLLAVRKAIMHAMDKQVRG